MVLRLAYEKIKPLREKRELSMREAGERAGFEKNPATDWNKFESGNRVNIELSTLGKLAKALGVDPQELITAKEVT